MPIDPAQLTSVRRPALSCAWILVALLSTGLPALAQNADKLRVRGSGFNAVLEYHAHPNETQIKALLQGAEAEHRAGGLVEIKSLKLQTFTENGVLEWVVIAPQCVFNVTHRTVSSPGPLMVRSANGNLRFAGEGFLWRQADLQLTVSNNVRSHIQGTFTNSILQ